MPAQKTHDFSIQALAKSISDSAISQEKKLFYLYLLAEGTFSLKTLKSLQQDMKKQGQKREKTIADLAKNIASLNTEIAKTEAEIARLTPLAEKELEENLMKLVDFVAKEEAKNITRKLAS